MRYFSKAAGAGLIAAGLFLTPAASAMSPQAPPINRDGTSKLADPDEAVERMADQQRSTYSHGRFRAFSDSSMDARDAVRPQVNDGRASRPFR
ncbi:hypothetical protein Sj15T_11910 [Sphingobium sp. TA15]|uniref:Hydroxyquinol 1,2-dioxygenase n=1 Tax=Sphingobium indicum (strain DSM 16413 / CCM 7287 / MTCC 6362 / UT26 / NBRC 101211 / UT26S) TaxID=452662 RepID=D4Z2A3_SPHIU|nr:hypothetical protein [Sphingobium indicum]BAI96735.1 hypothetical protein SJA_C1-19010 [Sphingobium indicum UT26S]BDD66170.1 hypothetical protein Sj15T_11910 [Sphingobium sp. TA15]